MVIGIIAVLIGILQPVITRAREQGKRAACLSQLHQIGLGLIQYADANRGRLPNGKDADNYDPDDAGGVLVEFANRYLKVPAVFHCPSSKLPTPTAIEPSDAGEENGTRQSYDFYRLYWPDAPRLGMAPLAWDFNGGDPKRSLKQNHGTTGGNVLYTDGRHAGPCDHEGTKGGHEGKQGKRAEV